MRFFPKYVCNKCCRSFTRERYAEEYDVELNRLMRFLPEALKDNEEAKKGRFIIGLNAQLQGHVNTFELTTYATEVNKAKLVLQG